MPAYDPKRTWQLWCSVNGHIFERAGDLSYLVLQAGILLPKRVQFGSHSLFRSPFRQVDQLSAIFLFILCRDQLDRHRNFCVFYLIHSSSQ